MVAPPACGPGQDTFATESPRLDLVARVGHRFWRCVGPKLRVWPLTSQVVFRSQTSGAVFSIADVLEVLAGLAQARVPSRCGRSLCPAFQRLSFGRPSYEDRQSRLPRAGAQ